MNEVYEDLKGHHEVSIEQDESLLYGASIHDTKALFETHLLTAAAQEGGGNINGVTPKGQASVKQGV